MSILSVIVAVAILWYFATRDRQARAELESAGAVEHHMQIQAARLDERAKAEEENRLATMRANAELATAFQARLACDENFKAKVRRESTAREDEDSDLAEGRRVALQKQALAWFGALPEHERRDLRARLLAERRAAALTRLTADRAQERDERKMALLAREVMDAGYREKAAERLQVAREGPLDERLARAEAAKDEAMAWFRRQTEDEQANLRVRFTPKTRAQQTTAFYAGKGLPSGLTEERLAAFLTRARDAIQYTCVERYAGLADEHDLLDRLDYLMAQRWEGIGERTALEHLCESGGEDRLLQWLLAELDRRAESARAFGV